MSPSTTSQAPVRPLVEAPRAAAAPPTAAPAPSPIVVEAFDVEAAWRRIRNDAWLWPKVGLLVGAVFLPAYAIWWALANESGGVSLAVVPDMLAAGVLLAAIVGGTLFLDEDHSQH